MKIIVFILVLLIPSTATAEWTQEDANMIAQVIWGEAKGIESTTQKAAIAWTILNRVDDKRFSETGTIQEVITRINQFTYHPHNPVEEEFVEIAIDVLNRWEREKNGEEDVGRILPPEYCFFGRLNSQEHVFRTTGAPKSENNWRWEIESPYDD